MILQSGKVYPEFEEIPPLSLVNYTCTAVIPHNCTHVHVQ